MATAKVITLSSSSVAIPVVEKITQDELTELIRARNTLAELRCEVDALESSIKSRLESGASIQPGVHVAALQERSRRSVEWKSVVARLAERLGMDGDVYCSRVLTATKPTKYFSLEIN
jgi:hypothetical protein